MSLLAACAALFVAAFVAASLLPAQSEALLLLLLQQGHSPALLLLAASLGNTLGSVLNWWLGRWIEHFRDRRWFPASPAQLARAERWYARWGHWSLLLSWVPVVGDPLTLIAGVLREPLWRFVLVVGVAKTGRYLALIWLAS